jgi:hypothetical protein
MKYGWKPEKNQKLKTGYKGRPSFTFDDVVQAISAGGFIDLVEYRGAKKIYQGQWTFVVRAKRMVWLVPAKWTGEFWFLRTIYPLE